jgi:NAD(P)-dependent dehydrogenase (short-subunit alcohol dehydrogenase family)
MANRFVAPWSGALGRKPLTIAIGATANSRTIGVSMSDTTIQPAAVVIGAASGMGLAVAEQFSAEGRRLVLADRDAAGLDIIATRLGAEAVRCDVTDSESVEHLAERAGDTSALVVTAGLSPTMGTFRQIMDVNLGGMARVLQAFEARLVSGGVVVCFASIAGHMGGQPSEVMLAAIDDPSAPDLSDRVQTAAGGAEEPGAAYTFSKVGVIRLARRLGKAWAARGVRVYSLSPGIIDTPMGRKEFDDQPFMAEMIKVTPMARQGLPTEIASVVGFLCSDAASYMTACDVLVDGGFVGATG